MAAHSPSRLGYGKDDILLFRVVRLSSDPTCKVLITAEYKMCCRLKYARMSEIA